VDGESKVSVVGFSHQKTSVMCNPFLLKKMCFQLKLLLKVPILTVMSSKHSYYFRSEGVYIQLLGKIEFGGSFNSQVAMCTYILFGIYASERL
jgi:hypothetical protein